MDLLRITDNFDEDDDDDVSSITEISDVSDFKELNNHVSYVIKYFILGFSIFFWIVGWTLLLVGYYVNELSEGYIPNFVIAPGTVVSILGFIIFSLSAIGILGSYRENICLLKIYKIFLIMTLFIEVFCGFISFAYYHEVKKLANQYIINGIEKYADDPRSRDVIDHIQSDMGCCGSLYPDDWDTNPYFNCRNVESVRSCGLPWSCCISPDDSLPKNRQCGYDVRKNRATLPGKVYMVGCLDRGFDVFQEVTNVVGGLTVAFTFPLIGALAFLPTFIRQIMRQRAEYDEEDGI